MQKPAATYELAAASGGAQINWRRSGLHAALSVLASAGFVWLLSRRLAHFDLAALAAGFAGLGLAHWLTALGFTLLSFAAIGRYDAVIHRHLDSGTAEKAARRAGICAIAISQTLGLGLITGSILRWRMLPGLSLWSASRLTAAVALSFLIGWGFVTALTLCLLPEAPFRDLAAFALTALLGLSLLSMLAPQRWRSLPNGFTLVRLVALTALDTLAAAAALWWLCPPPLDLPFLTLLPAFLLAFGAGLASGAPGGVGPFEITLLLLLPDQPEAALLGAVLAWRAVYYALPAVIAAAIALRGVKANGARTVPAPWALLRQFPRAELGLIWQGEHWLSTTGTDTGLLLARTRHCVIALFDPIAEPSRPTLGPCLLRLGDQARAQSCIPALYKTSPRPAAVARSLGYVCLRIASEAVIVLASYRIDGPKRAGLRRKLRHAQAAGISVTQPDHVLDWAGLDTIAADWARRHGGERGFSMGRYCRHYVSRQRLYVAWQHQRPIAFVSFHTAPAEWTLDLIRYSADLPDGTIHLLIQSAIEDARGLGLARISLAAVPDYTALPRPFQRWVARFSTRTEGLVRFKSAFAPQWHPRYLIARNRAALLLAAAEITAAILRPTPLPHHDRPTSECDPADNGFASEPDTWHRRGNRV